MLQSSFDVFSHVMVIKVSVVYSLDEKIREVSHFLQQLFYIYFL